MANPLLGMILGTVLTNAMRGRGRSAPAGGGGGGGLTDMLGGMMGRGLPIGRAGGLRGNRGMLLAMLLPFAMRWVQRNGGVGAVLERFRQKGYGQHAKSWLSTGENQHLEVDAVDNVVGREELTQLARQLGVQEEDISQGFAEILPEVMDKLSPEGKLPAEADDTLDAGVATLEKELNEIQTGITA